jgi:hypothetical protein
MLNCTERLDLDPLGFAHRIAALTDLNARRLREWLFHALPVRGPG